MLFGPRIYQETHCYNPPLQRMRKPKDQEIWDHGASKTETAPTTLNREG
jgi:hypothetical protein